MIVPEGVRSPQLVLGLLRHRFAEQPRRHQEHSAGEEMSCGEIVCPQRVFSREISRISVDLGMDGAIGVQESVSCELGPASRAIQEKGFLM